ncbi:MAG TPA: cytochrome c biogenesis protein DipZ [Gammaproteobacteria bacterium]|nr:cytochrome c biogenesis protein DipZ [Gammaproteobacteria bacterium]
MVLLAVAYLGGVLTILSPCILPVLPFVFARSDQPFHKSGLPLLLGMVLTFAGVATLAAVGGGWAVQANQWGRYVAMALLAFFGVTLLVPQLADRLSQPLVALGNRLSQTADSRGGGGSSFVLGIATGLLWAPCAGPILGLILAGAALSGASLRTAALLLAYAAGAATSLALALLVGGRVFAALKRSLNAGVWIRRGLGIAVLAGVALIATGLDTGLLTRVSLASTNSLEQSLLDRAKAVSSSGTAKYAIDPPTGLRLPVEGTLPSLSGATHWLNSPPLTPAKLRGKVVLIDFWTYSCINCLRALPYVQAWASRYADDGLVVIGVHTPEFAFEHKIDNVRQAVQRLHITFPVAMDNNYAIWRAFDNHYWPADYLVDAQGRIRYHAFGEGDYDKTEQVIRMLLKAAHHGVPTSLATVHGKGVQAAADFVEVRSPETYIGYLKARGFASGRMRPDAPRKYSAPDHPRLNAWGLKGTWTVQGEKAVLDKAPGSIVFKFHARDLNLVLGPGEDGKPVRFRVRVDGKAPGDAHGVDTDAAGNGVVTGERLYQLVRQPGDVRTHLFEIEFLDPGVQAYSFTFG